MHTKLDQKDQSQSLLAHLKYCCLTNLGNILLKKSNYHEALIHYQEVSYKEILGIYKYYFTSEYV